VIVPKANEGDLHWVRRSVLDALKVHFIRHVDEALEIALVVPGGARRRRA